MLNSYEKYFCNICHKNILITEKAIHENNCKSSINNNISNNSLNLTSNDIIRKETYSCPMCGDEINIKEKEFHQFIFHSYNDFNNNGGTENEETFNNEGILVSRNILSNYNSQELLDENNDFNTYNSIYYDGPNSFSDNLNIKNININKIIENLNVNIIKDDINKFSDKQCIICLEQFKKGDNYIFLPCMHFFHENCIKKWININNKCPFCNLEIN